MKNTESRTICQICNKPYPHGELFTLKSVKSSIINLIKKYKKGFDLEGYICVEDLNYYRALYIHDTLESEKGELCALDMEVKRSLEEHELISKNMNVHYEEKATFGERISDKIASFGGSWKFIISFSSFLIIWIIFNSIWFFEKGIFDPYPFILLNLILSSLAAFQAPIIMMSQNRQEAKDRINVEHDYKINLKAELEIRHLHEKIDHILTHQWQRLAEIQQIQMEMLDNKLRRKDDL